MYQILCSSFEYQCFRFSFQFFDFFCQNMHIVHIKCIFHNQVITYVLIVQFSQNQVCNHHVLCLKKLCIKYHVLVLSISTSITHSHIMTLFAKYITQVCIDPSRDPSSILSHIMTFNFIYLFYNFIFMLISWPTLFTNIFTCYTSINWAGNIPL